MAYKYLEVETIDDGAIVRILLNRPERRNAQNRGLLVELNDALMAAEAGRPGPRCHPRRERHAVLGRPRPRLA